VELYLLNPLVNYKQIQQPKIWPFRDLKKKNSIHHRDVAGFGCEKMHLDIPPLNHCMPAASVFSGEIPHPSSVNNP
jgi:hypothetical protein